MPRRKRKRAPGAGRPPLPESERKSRTIAVRIDDDEAATLARIDPSPSVAIHALIAASTALNEPPSE